MKKKIEKDGQKIKLPEPTLTPLISDLNEEGGTVKTKKYVDEFFEIKFIKEYFSKNTPKKK